MNPTPMNPTPMNPTPMNPTPMRLTVNGEARRTEARSLAALWAAETEHLEPTSRRGFAVALNGEVVRAALWDGTALSEGDRVEIIRAVAGG